MPPPVDVQDSQPCLYTVLGVERSASLDDIRRAYKRQALVLHPDKNPSDNAVHRFQVMQRAYDVLKDDKKRRVYDEGGMERLRKFEEHGEFPGFKAFVLIIVVAYACAATVPRFRRRSSPDSLRSAQNRAIWAAVVSALIVLAIGMHWTQDETKGNLEFSRCSLFPDDRYAAPVAVSIGNQSFTVYGVDSRCAEDVGLRTLRSFCSRVQSTVSASRSRLRPADELPSDRVPSPKTFRRFSKRTASRMWYPKYDPMISYTMTDPSSLLVLPPLCTLVGG